MLNQPTSYLRRALAPLVLTVAALGFVPVTIAQSSLNTYTYAPGASAGQSAFLLPVPAGHSGYLLAGYGRFGFDSSFANVAYLRPNLTVRVHRDYRLRLALSYVMTAGAMPFNRGYMLGGGASSTGAQPYVASLDTALAPRWSVVFTNLGSAQRYVVKVLPRSGTEFAAYSYTDGGDDDRLYALSGKLTGGGFRGRQLTPAPAGAIGRVRVFEGIAPEARRDRHYLVGTGRVFPNPREMDGLVMKLDSNRVRWGKVLDFGRPNEAVYSVIATADGNLVAPVVNYGFAGTINPTIVCKLDTAGTLLWAREISLGGGSLYLPLVAETLTGELVLAGSDANNALVLVKLSATGTLIWARRTANTGTIVGQLTRTPAGTFLLAGPGYTITQFDGTGNGCNLIPEPTVAVATLPVTGSPVINFPFTTTAFAPTTLPQTLLPRAQPLTRGTACVAVGLAEENAIPVPLTAWPNPATGRVHLTGLSAAADVLVLDAQGRVVRRQPLPASSPETELEVRGLPPGLYLVRVGWQAVRLMVE